MAISNIYRIRAARKPLHFWLQPFLLLLLIGVLWRLLPVGALLFRPRVVQPLPDAHVFYVTLDPGYAAEVLRLSMQTWRRSTFGGGSDDDINLDAIDPFTPLGDPAFLRQGRFYPGKWGPRDITPLAQELPGLLCPSVVSGNFNEKPPAMTSEGVRILPDTALEKANFIFPVERLSALDGIGNCRACVETDGEGRVVHVLILENDGGGAAEIERALSQGRAAGAVNGEIRILWRKPR